jgi:hypothetical protein
LDKYNWNESRCLEQFNHQKFIRKQYKQQEKNKEEQKTTFPFKCEICLEFKTNSDSLFSLRCGHLFCFDCYSETLTTKIKEGSLILSCPDSTCFEIISDKDLKILVGSITFDLFQRKWKQFIISKNRRLNRCPKSNCNKIIPSSTNENTNAKCVCGFQIW